MKFTPKSASCKSVIRKRNKLFVTDIANHFYKQLNFLILSNDDLRNSVEVVQCNVNCELLNNKVHHIKSVEFDIRVTCKIYDKDVMQRAIELDLESMFTDHMIQNYKRARKLLQLHQTKYIVNIL